MDYSFDEFVDGCFDYDANTQSHTCIWLREEKMNVGGGKISITDIDKLTECPDADVVTISGLRQDTFEYFIKAYGKQLKAIRFFKNKFVEDLSILGTLSQLEYVYFFANQRVEHLWDMSKNTSLTGLAIDDFSRLFSIDGIETAPSLKEFLIGNVIWDKLVLESLMPLANTHIEKVSFWGRAITDNNLSFIEKLPGLKVFDFPTNVFTTEQVAWIAANFPQIEGFALRAKRDCLLYKSSSEPIEVPGTIIVGKRKPSLVVEGNEERIKKYVESFEKLKLRYKGVSYRNAF